MSPEEDLITFDDHLESSAFLSDGATCSSSQQAQSWCSVEDPGSQDPMPFHDELESSGSSSIKPILPWRECMPCNLFAKPCASTITRRRNSSGGGSSSRHVRTGQTSSVYRGHALAQNVEPGSNASSTHPGMCHIANSKQHKASSRSTRSRSQTCHKTSRRGPTSYGSAHPNINDQLFSNMLRGVRTHPDTHRLVLQNEISYSFTPIIGPGAKASEGRDAMVGDAETMRRNMANLVKGQGGVYPKGRVKGWGVGEIQRGTKLDGEMGDGGTRMGL